MQYVKCQIDEVGKLCSKIYDTLIQMEFRPDIIVSIDNGGRVPATILAELFSCRSIHRLKISKYDVNGSKLHDPIIEKYDPSGLEPLIRNDLLKILIVDDVIENGDTMNLAVKKMMQLSQNITICCLVTKDKKFKTAYLKVNVLIGKIISDEQWVMFEWENDKE